MIYLDNAATSYPKHRDCLRQALEHYLEFGASPGRGGYDLAIEAEVAVERVRKRLTGFFGAGDNAHVCFAANATDALNTIILGLVEPGCHVISSRLEHNSVLRPLHHLQQQGDISIDLVPFDKRGYIDPATIAARLRPETRFVVITHASNVLGTVQPVDQIGAICRQYNVPLILDVAQTAGCIPINMQEWDVQGLAFTGHKSLLGPVGIGGLLISPNLDPRPTRFGGTGIDSTSRLQPSFYPSRLEAGTINLLGILCLDMSLDFIETHIEEHFHWEMELFDRLVDGLRQLPRVNLFAADISDDHLPLLSCTVDDIASTDVGAILDGDFNIAVRTGLHCAPLVHEDLGTLENGTIRFSLGPFTTTYDIDATIKAMEVIAD